MNLPAEEVPPELPEPALGINFARDGMDEKDWLSLVAVHSDAWLLAVSFYFGARFGFDKESRYSLFFEFCYFQLAVCAMTITKAFAFYLRLPIPGCFSIVKSLYFIDASNFALFSFLFHFRQST